MYIIDEESEKKEILKKYRKIFYYWKTNISAADKKLIRKAFNIAVTAHKDMRRKSGEPYIYHPLEVAQIIVQEIGLGTTSVICALLHDVVEDTDYNLSDIEAMFGSKIAKIIDGLTKIDDIFDQANLSIQAENFKKILLTLSDDVRVILIKLADRLHNMRTLDSMPKDKQLKIASETIYLYAPLAHRLGLHAIKSELEDLSLKYTEPAIYETLTQKLKQTEFERNLFIEQFIHPIKQELLLKGFKFSIFGRAKSIYSIWGKMKKKQIPFEEVFDLFAIRIIIDTDFEREKADCWNVYTIVTSLYRPNPDRLRDWISIPKANGYEALHTTVMSHSGKWVEVQIRTQRMEEIAEKGYAAHWKYKENSDSKSNLETGLDDWLNKIKEILPHRPPFLLVDKILEMSENHVIGLKNVTMNEHFFVGHFPNEPVMPGVLQIEAMAQVGGIMALSSVPDPENYATYFMKIDNVRFRNKVVPGDTIIFRLDLLSPIRRGLCNMKGVAYVGTKIVMEAEMLAQITKVK